MGAPHQLRTGFAAQSVPIYRDDGSPAVRQDLDWVEAGPRRLFDAPLEATDMNSRARLWRARHRQQRAVCCAEAWPPMPLS